MSDSDDCISSQSAVNDSTSPARDVLANEVGAEVSQSASERLDLPVSPERTNKRLRSYTAKGLEYKVAEVKRRFSRCVAGLNSARQCVARLSVTSKDADEVRRASSSMYNALDELTKCYRDLGQLFDQEALGEFEQALTQAEGNVEKAAELAKTAIQCLSFESARSETASSRHSKSSRSKSVTTSVSKISLQEERIRNIQKSAALKAELKFIDAQTKLDAEAKRLSVQREIAGLEAGIKASGEAEFEELNQRDLEVKLLQLPVESKNEKQERIIKSMDNFPTFSKDKLENLVVVNDNSSSETKVKKAAVNSKNLFGDIPIDLDSFSYDAKAIEQDVTPARQPEPSQNNLYPEGICVTPVSSMLYHKGNDSGHTPTENNDTRMLTAIAGIVNESMSAPKLECLKFAGDPLFYVSFKQSFSENIDKRQLSSSQKLNFLVQFTEGKARRAIDHCTNILPPDKGYKLALSTLYERFGHPQIITSAFKNKLFNHPILRNFDKEALYDYSSILRKCFETLRSIGNVAELNNSLSQLSEKLPLRLHDPWNRRYAKISYKNQRTPTFEDFVSFVEVEASLYNAYPEQNKDVRRTNARRVGIKQNLSRAMCANVVNNSPPALKCYYCEDSHVLTKCEAFLAVTLKERRQFLNSKGRCFNCFNKHATKECRKPYSCSVKDCKGRHHTMMHNYNALKPGGTVPKEPHSEPSGEASATTHTIRCDSITSCRRGYFNVVPVKIRANEREVSSYAFLDLGSDTTFCNKKLVQSLGLTGKPKRLTLSTLGHRHDIYESLTVSFTIASLDGTAKFDIDNAVTIDHLPVLPNGNLSENDLISFPHLKSLKLPMLNNATVDVLIGNDVIRAHKVLEEREGNGNQPNAIRTPLGWSLIGPSIGSCSKGKASAHFAMTDEAFDKAIQQSWYQDFEKDELSYPTSVEDRKVLSILKENVTNTNGHFYAPLPWRDGVVLPDNSRFMAERRLASTKKRLQNDDALREKYISQMNEYIHRGYSERVGPDEECNERFWYLPHHPVCSPNKPDKVRIVFDCAAKHRGICLNDALMQGPDLVNSIISVLTRFRRESVALVADVESMFHQVRIMPEDRDCFRFLWWPNGNLSKPPAVHRMLVHIFGATSSPCCATYCMRQSAVQFGSNFDPAISEVINRDFYVDDCLTSTDSVQSAIALVQGLRELLSLGGFRLTKWISSSPEVLRSIPLEERSKSFTSVNLENNTNERVLGVHWNVSSDEFGLNVKDNLKRKVFTRRLVLSTVNSLYDPLGFVAPVILVARILQQKVIELHSDWDEELSESDVQEWNNWLDELTQLRKLTLPRCFKPAGFRHVITYQVHHFCDASVRGYGFVTYLRLEDESCLIYCSFLCGKAKVTPPRSESIPRLELVAAVLAVKADHWIRNHLEFPNCQSIFWTDSSAVRHSISNKTKRFRTFVANRLAKIHRQTEPSQ